MNFHYALSDNICCSGLHEVTFHSYRGNDNKVCRSWEQVMFQNFIFITSPLFPGLILRKVSVNLVRKNCQMHEFS